MTNRRRLGISRREKCNYQARRNGSRAGGVRTVMTLARKTLNYVLFLALLVLSVSCDQGTKLWARHSLAGKPSVTVIDGYWDFHFAENPHGAFSLFRGLPYGRWVLAAFAAGMLIVLVTIVRRQSGGPRLTHVALGLIAGGAVGNLYDRLAYGRVTDFVHWHVRAYEWPVFNVADAALLVGVLLMVVTWRPRAVA
jgi:signal peptidase II